MCHQACADNSQLAITAGKKAATDNCYAQVRRRTAPACTHSEVVRNEIISMVWIYMAVNLDEFTKLHTGKYIYIYVCINVFSG